MWQRTISAALERLRLLRRMTPKCCQTDVKLIPFYDANMMQHCSQHETEVISTCIEAAQAGSRLNKDSGNEKVIGVKLRPSEVH